MLAPGPLPLSMEMGVSWSVQGTAELRCPGREGDLEPGRKGAHRVPLLERTMTLDLSAGHLGAKTSNGGEWRQFVYGGISNTVPMTLLPFSH